MASASSQSAIAELYWLKTRHPAQAIAIAIALPTKKSNTAARTCPATPAAFCRKPGGLTSGCSMMKGTISPPAKCTSSSMPTSRPTLAASLCPVMTSGSISVAPYCVRSASVRLPISPQSHCRCQKCRRHCETYPKSWADQKSARRDPRQHVHRVVARHREWVTAGWAARDPVLHEVAEIRSVERDLLNEADRNRW